MSARLVLPVILVAAILPSPAALAAVTAWTEIDVRVYDTSGTPMEERHASLDVASSIVSAAAIKVKWKVCDHRVKGQEAKGKGTGNPCESPLRGGELAVRIVRSVATDDHQRELPLGDAVIDTRAGKGVLATVYFDRVAWMASQTAAKRSDLLGRAIAHELGHLLMATTTHGVDGLMRPVWSRNELQQSRLSDWNFGPGDIAAIKARTLAR